MDTRKFKITCVTHAIFLSGGSDLMDTYIQPQVLPLLPQPLLQVPWIPFGLLTQQILYCFPAFIYLQIFFLIFFTLTHPLGQSSDITSLEYCAVCSASKFGWRASLCDLMTLSVSIYHRTCRASWLSAPTDCKQQEWRNCYYTWCIVGVQ